MDRASSPHEPSSSKESYQPAIMTANGNPKLFTPIALGSLTLSHRIVLPPLTRFRANSSHVPLNFVKDYYVQRASTPGTLLMTESNSASPRAGLIPHMPGIWSEEQIAAWKTVVDEVHSKGSYIFCHIGGQGRAGDPDELARYGYDVIGPSAIPAPGYAGMPREMSENEIQELIRDFAIAAKNAVEKSGFDGVEIHACNGYLLDQFTQDVSNQRTDSWGGSIEKRSRFATEVAKAVVEAVGNRVPVGVRLSPWGQYAGMRMRYPIPQFTHLISELRKLDLAYLHLIEPRVSGDVDVDADLHRLDSNIAFLEAWGTEKPVIVAGGITPGEAQSIIDEKYGRWNVAVAFGRLFISNPDLVFRVQRGLALSKYDRSTFYTEESPKGYIDYSFSEDFVKTRDGHISRNGVAP